MSPHPDAIASAVEQATMSPCRSQRGAVVFDPASGYVMCGGFNAPPAPFSCDRSDRCRLTCPRLAVHAEMRALAGFRVAGFDMLHVKARDGIAIASGRPSCVDCSKHVLAAGIANFWLLHAHGWERYPARTFHELSAAACGLALA